MRLEHSGLHVEPVEVVPGSVDQGVQGSELATQGSVDSDMLGRVQGDELVVELDQLGPDELPGDVQPGLQVDKLGLGHLRSVSSSTSRL